MCGSTLIWINFLLLDPNGRLLTSLGVCHRAVIECAGRSTLHPTGAAANGGEAVQRAGAHGIMKL
jgi:hypothetical protein